MSKKAARKGRGRPKKAAKEKLDLTWAAPPAGATMTVGSDNAEVSVQAKVYSDNDQRVERIRDIFTSIGRIDQRLVQVAADRKEYQEQRESCFQEIKRITFDSQDRLPLAEKTEERICADCGKRETVAPTTGGRAAGWITLDIQARKFLCAECDHNQKLTEAAGDFIVEEGKISAVAIQDKFGVKHSEAKSLLFALIDAGLLEKAGAGNILKLNPKATEEWKANKAKEEKAEGGK